MSELRARAPEAPSNQDRLGWPTRAAELVAGYGVAAVVLCLPLEFTTLFMHQQLSRIVIAIVAISYVYLLVVRRRTLVFPRYPSVFLLLLFLAVALVSWLATRASGSTSAVVDIALYPVVALLVSNLLLTERDHRRAWTAFLVSGLAVALIGLALHASGTHIWAPNPAVANRLNITFADPNITARFLTLGACVAVLLFAARKAPAWLAIAGAIACGAVLPLTLSRSGLALFIVGIVVAVAFAFNHRRAAAIGAVALLALAISTGVNVDTRQRAIDAATTAVTALTGTTHNVTSGSGAPAGQQTVTLDDNRRYLVAAGLKMFADHPVFGVGFGGYQHSLLTAYRRFLPAGYTDSVSHTSMVTVIAEQGLVGTLLFLAFLIQLAREALSARRRPGPWAVWATLSAVLIIPIFLYSQFEARFLQEPYLWLSLGLLYSAKRQAERDLRIAQPGAESLRPRRLPARSVEAG